MIIVGITGASGSGKTYLAKLFKQQMGATAERLELDDIYTCASDFDPESKSDADALKRLAHFLENTKRGKRTCLVGYNFTSKKKSKVRVKAPICCVLIVDSLLLLCTQELRNALDLSIFVRTPLRLCLQRRIARDIRKQDLAKIKNRWKVVIKQYKQVIMPLAKYATIICYNTEVPVETTI